MPKRKKKPSPVSQQKITKARIRNEFVSQLKTIIDKAAGPGIFRLIPQQEIEYLNLVRCLPVKIKAGPEQNISSAMLKDSQSLLTRLLKLFRIPIGIGELSEMSLYDYFSIGFTIIFYSGNLKEDDYPHAAEVKKALAPFAAIDTTTTYNEGWKKYGNIMYMIALFNSDISSNLYTVKFNQNLVDEKSIRPGFSMEIYCVQTPKISILIDGHNRPAYRLARFISEPAPHLEFISIRSEEINLPPGNLLNVYIQSHALNRLAERMEGFVTGILHFNLFESLNNLKVCKNKRGDLLFEFKLFGNKAGYFKGDIIDNQLILRTFLFLTNNGTPESEKLHANTGLMKEDKKYLSIDKIGPFFNSDIPTNERVKQLFIDAGCESIFKIERSFYIPPEGAKEKSIADFIVKYLQLDIDTPSLLTMVQSSVELRKEGSKLPAFGL